MEEGMNKAQYRIDFWHIDEWVAVRNIGQKNDLEKARNIIDGWREYQPHRTFRLVELRVIEKVIR